MINGATLGTDVILTGFLEEALEELAEMVIVIRWEELTVFGMLVFILRFLFAKCRGKQESPPSFILSNKERKKAKQNSFFEIFLSTGGRL